MKNLNLKSVLMFGVLSGIFFPIPENAETKVITAIEINGNKRVSPEAIKNRLPIEIGDDIDDNDANNIIEDLYKSELFNDVKIKFSGSTLVINVKEAPTINKISIEGSKKIKEENLPGIRQKEAMSLSKIKTSQMELLQTYQSKNLGMYNATVNPKVIKRSNEKVDLVFEIDERRPTKISEIVFHGNNKIQSSELRQIISSRPKRWYRFMVNDDIYDPERLEYDKRLIVQYYKNNGFAQARVSSVSVDLTPDGHGVIISFNIHEGDRFKFGNISIKSNVKRINSELLNKKSKCKTGKNFNETFVSVDTTTILNDINKQGISAVEVEPKFETDIKTKKINVRYDVEEGERKYISKIIIRGNEKTRDHVILQKLMFEEGDLYNKSLISLSESNLQSTGFFEFVHIDTIPDPISPDKCVVIVSVKKQKTGEMSLNAKYDQIDGPVLSIGYGERNFFGTGKSLNLSINSSREQTGKCYEFKDGKLNKIDRKSKFALFNNITASFGNPHMFGRDIEGTLSLYRYSSSPLDSFSVKNIGGAVGMSYPLASNWTQSWELSCTRRLIDNVVEQTSPLIKYQIAVLEKNKFGLDKNLKYYQHKLSHTIGYSTHVYDGLLKGNYSVSLSTAFMYNTNSQQIDIKNILSGSYTRPFRGNMILKCRATYGMLNALGDKEANVIDGFSNTINSVRGFSEYSIGGWAMSARGIKKLDGKDQYVSQLLLDATTTKMFFNGSIEVSFPIYLLPEMNTRFFVFADCGYYSKPIDPKNNVFDKTKYSAKDLYNFNKKQLDENKAASKAKRKAKTFKLSDVKPTGTEDEIIVARSGLYEEKMPKMLCKFESDKDTFNSSTLIAHKVVSEKILRVSLGVGFSFVTPFGPIRAAWGFPIRKGKLDTSNMFIIGMHTSF